MQKNKQNKNRDCIFLSEDALTCTIHPVRPTQCSTYPWWPELVDKEDWELERKDICEGFDHAEAEPVNLVEAAEQLRLANKENQIRKLSKKDDDADGPLGLVKKQKNQMRSGHVGFRLGTLQLSTTRPPGSESGPMQFSSTTSGPPGS
eukprot:gene16804-23085_t